MDKPMDDIEMYIPILIHTITPSIDYNWWLKRLDTQLVEPTNQNLFKVYKIIKKTFLKNFGD